MNTNRGPEGLGFKRTRPPVADCPDDQTSTHSRSIPSPRDRADPPNAYYAMPSDMRDGTSPRVSDYRDPPREREEVGFSSERAGRVREVRNRRDHSNPPVRSRARRYSSSRHDDRDHNQRILASTYRPEYYSPPRPGPVSSETKGSSAHTSTAENSHSGRYTTSKMDQPSFPPPTDLDTSTKSAAVVPQPSHADAAKEFGLLLHQLIDEATDLAALKNQKNAARKDFERKDGEFKKSKPIHEKFPATEEVQRRSKDQAMKVLNSIIEKCDKKDATLKDIAIQGAARFVPGLIGAGASGHDQEKLQAQVDALEKTCQDFQKQLQEQQRFIQDQQKSREALERKHHELAAKYGSAQGDWGITKNRQAQFDQDIRPKVQEMLHKISESETDIEVLKRDSSAVTRNLSEVSAQILADLSQKFDKLDSLSGRIDECLNLRLDFSKAKEDSARSGKVIADISKFLEEYSQKLENLESFVRGTGGGREGLSRHIATLAQEQDGFRTELKMSQAMRNDVIQLGDRVTAVENRTNPASLEGRLATAETQLSSVGKLLSDADLAMLRGRLAKVETLATDNIEPRLSKVETPNLSAASNPTNVAPFTDLLLALQSQLASLEQQVRNIPNIEKRVEYFERNDNFQVMASESANVHAELMAAKQRLSALEEKGSFVQRLPDSTSKPDLNPLQERIKSIEKEIDSISVIRKCLGDVENKVLLVDGIQTRLVAIEEENISRKLSLFERRLAGLEMQRPSAEPVTSASTPTTVIRTENMCSDLETIKEEVMAVVAESQSVADNFIGGRIEGLNARVRDLETRVRSTETLCETMKNNNEQISALSSAAQQLQQTHSQTENRLSNAIGLLEVRYNTWVRSQQGINGVLEERVEAVSIGIINIDKRLASINTKDMALHILNQLDLAYPDVRFVQDSIADCKKSLHLAETSMAGLVSTVTQLKGQVETIESRLQENPDFKTTQALRKEVDELTRHISKVGTLTKETKDGLAAIRDETHRNLNAFAGRLGEIYTEIKELKDYQNTISKIQPPAPKPASKSATPAPAVENSDGATLSYGNSVNSIRGRSQQGSDRPSPGEPADKKRKTLNGRAISRTNGRHTNSPARKRKRLFVDGDDSDDSNFEPVEPRISDDEDDL